MRTVDRIGLGLASLRAQWKRLGGPPSDIAATLRASSPVASEGTVTSLEATLGVALPEDYRDFVTRVSGGGIGPGIGLFSLDDRAQWNALRSRRWAAPSRSIDRFELTRDGWGRSICLRLRGELAGTLWIDDDNGPRPMSVAGEPMKSASNAATFGPWFLRWIDDQREADAVILERPAAVSLLVELSRRTLAPARSEELHAHEFDSLSPEEAWESLVAREYVHESDERRSFASACPARTKSGSRVHPKRCARCRDTGRVIASSPATVRECLAVARIFPTVLVAEPLALELATRLNEWCPITARTIRWTPYDEARLIERSRPGGDRVDLQSVFTFAFDRIAGVGARTQTYLRECDEVIARVLGSNAAPAKLLAASLASRHLTIERLRDGRTSVAFEELARYSPFEPAVALWKSGVALCSIDDNAIELMYPTQ